METIIYLSALVIGAVCLVGGHSLAKCAETDIALSAKMSTYDGCSPRMAYVFYGAFPILTGLGFIMYGTYCLIVPAL